MKKIGTRIITTALAVTMALAPMAANAAELRTVKYNPEVTTSSGALKLGYKETTDSTKTWWKTETYYTDWQETNAWTYNAVKDADLKYMTDTDRSDWRSASKQEYEAVKAERPDDAQTNGYTGWKSTDKATYDKTADELRNVQYGDWKPANKAAYDKESDPNRKYTEKSDWTAFADESNWAAKYDEWLQYAEDCRRIAGASDFVEVSEEAYKDYAAKFPGKEGEYFKYEDIGSKSTFEGWPLFEEQIITNYYDAECHDPGFVLAGEKVGPGQIEGYTWDGKNDGLRKLDGSNGLSAQNIAAGVMDLIKANGVPYKTINSGSEIPALGANKFNEHVNDGIHNAGNGGGNAFIDIVDKDFAIYYYAGNGDITVSELYGILIAPNAKVTINGNWIGTIIADKVTAYGESKLWSYLIEKGDVERKFYVRNLTLEVKDDLYWTRCACYSVRDFKYQVRDVVKKYFVRCTCDKKYYCEAAPYIPQTGDISFGIIIGGMVLVIGAGVALIVASRKKKTN